jgi:GGDEF domain-containing protein
MVVCDVDGFKEVNDRYGHDRGDAVLRDIAYELRKRLRSFELIYRLGGEEFLILLPGIERAAGLEIAERLRASVEEAEPTGIHTTISLGLSGDRRRRRGVAGAAGRVTVLRLARSRRERKTYPRHKSSWGMSMHWDFYLLEPDGPGWLGM